MFPHGLRRPSPSVFLRPHFSRGLVSSSGSGGRSNVGLSESELEVIAGVNDTQPSPTHTHGLGLFLESAAEAVGLPPPNGFTQSGLTLAALGACAALVRVGAGVLYSFLERRLVVKVEVSGTDEAYSWMLAWLADQNFVRQSTRFAVHVTPSTGRSTTSSSAVDQEFAHLPAYQFLPSPNCTHWFWYKNRLMWITRIRPKPTAAMANSSGPVMGERIVVSTIGHLWHARNSPPPAVTHHTNRPTHPTHIQSNGARKALEDLVEESRRKYAERDLQRTVIYSADQYGNWRRTRSRPIRPLSTIVLDGSTKQTVLCDALEFLKNEKWYADRGIPYRRGYMFYGYPGTGKTSFVTALAGELKLNIYVISLANKGLTDETLTELMVDTPPRCILLLEDIDAAFVSRSLTSTVSATTRPGTPAENQNSGSIVTNVTFSGLLNAIDGVAAQEGRILVMTTNHIEKLDPALIRPGRVDVKVLFDKATRAQVKDLFVQFFIKPPVPATDETTVQSSIFEDNPSALEDLAMQFSQRVPEKGVSMAAVQGHLMRYKSSPEDAVKEAETFVQSVLGSQLPQ